MTRPIKYQAWLVAVALLTGTGFIPPAHGETVKLKDGTAIEGVLLAEDDRQVTLEVQFASGTITAKRTIQKADIAEIVRPTAEERVQREMERAFQNARKLQLDPAGSFALERYDEVISGVFLPFFAQYPNSPHEKELSGLLAQWQSEREQVASGKAKVRGQWMAAVDAAKLIEQERVEHCMKQGRAFLAAAKYEHAIAQFRTAGSLTRRPEVAAEAHTLQTEAYGQWLSGLERDQRRLTREVDSAKACASNAKRELAYAEKELANHRERMRSYKRKSLGPDSVEQSHLKQIGRLKTELAECESKQSLAWNQLGIAEREMATAKHRQQALGPAPSLPAPAVAAQKQSHQPPSSPPAQESEPVVAKLQRTAPPTAYTTERPPPSPVPSGEEFMSVLNSKVSSAEPTVSMVGVGRWKIPSPFQLIYDVMTGKGSAVTIVGLVITIVGSLWLVVAAFLESIVWGLASVAIPFANLFFAVVHFREAKWPLLVTVVGWILMYAGVYGA